MDGYTSRGITHKSYFQGNNSQVIFIFSFLGKSDLLLRKGKNLFLLEQILSFKRNKLFSLRVNPISGGLCKLRKQTGSHERFSLSKYGGKHRGVPIHPKFALQVRPIRSVGLVIDSDLCILISEYVCLWYTCQNS